MRINRTVRRSIFVWGMMLSTLAIFAQTEWEGLAAQGRAEDFPARGQWVLSSNFSAGTIVQVINLVNNLKINARVLGNSNSSNYFLLLSAEAARNLEISAQFPSRVRVSVSNESALNFDDAASMLTINEFSRSPLSSPSPTRFSAPPPAETYLPSPPVSANTALGEQFPVAPQESLGTAATLPEGQQDASDRLALNRTRTVPVESGVSETMTLGRKAYNQQGALLSKDPSRIIEIQSAPPTVGTPPVRVADTETEIDEAFRAVGAEAAGAGEPPAALQNDIFADAIVVNPSAPSQQHVRLSPSPPPSASPPVSDSAPAPTPAPAATPPPPSIVVDDQSAEKRIPNTVGLELPPSYPSANNANAARLIEPTVPNQIQSNSSAPFVTPTPTPVPPPLPNRRPSPPISTAQKDAAMMEEIAQQEAAQQEEPEIALVEEEAIAAAAASTSPTHIATLAPPPAPRAPVQAEREQPTPPPAELQANPTPRNLFRIEATSDDQITANLLPAGAGAAITILDLDASYIQVGAFRNIRVAEEIAKKLEQRGYSTFVYRKQAQAQTQPAQLNRILVGPVPTDEMGSLLVWIRSQGFEDAFSKKGSAL